MSINATLLGQMITFMLFVWFTMRYVWPPIKTALDERALKISEGLAAAELGNQQLREAEGQAKSLLKEAHQKAQQIIEKAEKQADALLEQARDLAGQEKMRILASAELELDQAYAKAKQHLNDELADLVVLSTEKVLRKTLSDDDKKRLLLHLD